ncbi:MAG: hypothetical protein QOI51_2446 [Nocardioidaceae bacterium]|jgi:hypothetical protein|nr:hypothetical protein [Nocardioidaceae bacterium]
MPTIDIVIINASTQLTDDEVSAAVPALQTQVSRDFAPAWGMDATLSFVPTGSKPKDGAWWISILDNSDQAGALGYHDMTPDGLPLGKVFAATDSQYGLSWTVTTSHELLEMLGDPDINLTALEQTSNTAGRLYAYEVCDACESDTDAYEIDGVKVSDFVYPAWFESFRGAGTKFDHMSKIEKAFQLLPEGYISIFDMTGAGWTQMYGEKAMHYASRAPVGSRRERRRIPRQHWLRSDTDAISKTQAAMAGRRRENA